MPTLHLTQDEAADELLGRDPLALLLGVLLDQHLRQRSSGTLAEGEAGDGTGPRGWRNPTPPDRARRCGVGPAGRLAWGGNLVHGLIAVPDNCRR